jgi:DNA (cytosine-5)-methyltransferase 1
MRPVILDAYCGAGGAAMGYHRAGFDIIGVDIKQQPNYPFPFIWDDAIELLTELASVGFADQQFAAVHASPPCQRWSTKTNDPDSHPDLLTPTRTLLEASGLPYIIENVPGAPLDGPILCGSSFNLDVRRHRRFETNFPILVPSCAHGVQIPRFTLYDHGKEFLSGVVHVFGAGGGKGREHWSEAMGIDWMTDPELADAIPPAYTELLGAQLLAHIQQERSAT